MTLHRFSSRSHRPATLALWAGALLLAASGAQAASGYTVRHAQESRVHVGMTEAQVRAVLGRPARHMHFRNQPGPTFTYTVQDARNTLFDVDFDRHGRVASTSERAREPGGGDPWHGRR